jgi:putative addiction module killer protein
MGLSGDWRSVHDGVYELRVDYGPGYRVYFAQDGPRLVLLLIGGDKRTQDRDIRQAKKFWKDYGDRKGEQK